MLTWIKCFTSNSWSPEVSRLKGELQLEETVDEENELIMFAQRENFKKSGKALSPAKSLLKASKFFCLRVRSGEDSVLQCDERLKYAAYLPYDARFLILPPRKNWITKLIVKN